MQGSRKSHLALCSRIPLRHCQRLGFWPRMEFLVVLHPIPSLDHFIFSWWFLSCHSFHPWFSLECCGPWVCCWAGEALFSDWCCQRIWGQIRSWEGQGRQGKWQLSPHVTQLKSCGTYEHSPLNVGLCFSCGKTGHGLKEGPSWGQVLWPHSARSLVPLWEATHWAERY